MTTGRSDLAGAGTQTAGLAFGGNNPVTGITEEYNGSSWTNGGTMGTARYGLGNAGIQTSALAFGGGPSYKNNTESYDGSSWTATATMISGRRQLGGCGASNTSALAFGGSNPAPLNSVTEEFTGALPAATKTVGTD